MCILPELGRIQFLQRPRYLLPWDAPLLELLSSSNPWRILLLNLYTPCSYCFVCMMALLLLSLAFSETLRGFLTSALFAESLHTLRSYPFWSSGLRISHSVHALYARQPFRWLFINTTQWCWLDALLALVFILCPFLSLKGWKCPLENSCSSTPCWACRVFNNPVKIHLLGLFSIPELKRVISLCTLAPTQCPPNRVSRILNDFDFLLNSHQSSPSMQPVHMLNALKVELYRTPHRFCLLLCLSST